MALQTLCDELLVQIIDYLGAIDTHTLAITCKRLLQLLVSGQETRWAMRSTYMDLYVLRKHRFGMPTNMSQRMLKVVPDILASLQNFIQHNVHSAEDLVPCVRAGGSTKEMLYHLYIKHYGPVWVHGKLVRRAFDIVDHEHVDHGHPTLEQQSILRTVKNQSLILQAGAGMGKTFVLQTIAEHESSKSNILYLCYNNALVAKGIEAFTCNVTCRTFHSLAYSWYYSMTPRDGERETSSHVDLGREDVGRFLSITGKALIAIVMETLTRFCHSDHLVPIDHDVPRNAMEKLEGSILYYARMRAPDLSAEARSAKANLVAFAVDGATKLWNAMAKTPRRLPATSDVILKLFQLHALKNDVFSGVTMLLLDEGQDHNKCCVSIALGFQRRMVVAQDQNQKLYGFLGAVGYRKGATQRCASPAHLEVHALTKSFRFSEAIGLLSSTLLFQQKVVGVGKFHTQILPPCTIPPCNQSLRVICRTNGMVCIQALTFLAKGGYRVYVAPGRARSILQTLNKPLKKTNIEPDALDDEALRVYLKRVFTKWAELIPRLEPANAKYGDDDPVIVVETVHSAKGQEYAHIMLTEDYSRDGKEDDGHSFIYTALTRVRTSVIVNTHMWDLAMKVFGASPKRASCYNCSEKELHIPALRFPAGTRHYCDTCMKKRVVTR